MKTKRLNLTIQCTAVYNSAIQVPDDMSLEETSEGCRALRREDGYDV